MSSILDTSSYYNYTNAASAAATDTYKTSALENTLNKADESYTDEELMDACKQFETYFVQKVFEEMQKTVHREEDDNAYVKQFGDILTQAYAENVTESGQLGIAQTLYDSMKRNM